MKTSSIALIVRHKSELPVLVETLSNENEIQFIDDALKAGECDPLERIYELRASEEKQEDDLGNYIEDLLSQAFLKPEIQQNALQWLRSKIKIEQYQKAEKEAAAVIAGYAYRIFEKDPSKTDFFLAGPSSQVRVRVFVLAGH